MTAPLNGIRDHFSVLKHQHVVYYETHCKCKIILFLKHMHEYPGILSGGRTVHSSLLLVATSVLVNQALHSLLQYKPSVTDIGKVFLNIFLM